MKPEVSIHATADALAAELAADFCDRARLAQVANRPFHAAFSGGRTPRILLALMRNTLCWNQVPWEIVHIWWSDERCVSPDDPHSNYRLIREAFLDPDRILPERVHRMRGEEADPAAEARRYGLEMESMLHMNEQGFPALDWVWLGMGEDGAVAALYPGQPPAEADTAGAFCRKSVHPATGENRITLTLGTLNAARRVVFPILGVEKAEVATEILNHRGAWGSYPAAWVRLADERDLTWYLDEEAACLL